MSDTQEELRDVDALDTAAFLIDYECGELSYERMTDGFQHLIDDGTVWQLQGRYGRTAAALIDAGHCHAKSED